MMGRRLAANASRSRMIRFSSASRLSRAASHSSRDTICGFSIMLVDILISPWIRARNDCSCSVHFSSGFDGVGRGLFMAFFPPSFLIAIAASPPVDVTLPAISAAVVMHTGHMGFSLTR